MVVIVFMVIVPSLLLFVLSLAEEAGISLPPGAAADRVNAAAPPTVPTRTCRRAIELRTDSFSSVMMKLILQWGAIAAGGETGAYVFDHAWLNRRETPGSFVNECPESRRWSKTTGLVVFDAGAARLVGASPSAVEKSVARLDQRRRARLPQGSTMTRVMSNPTRRTRRRGVSSAHFRSPRTIHNRDLPNSRRGRHADRRSSAPARCA